MVENLGKELLVTGTVGGSNMRLTVEETGVFEKQRRHIGDRENPLWVNFGTRLNVFGGEGRTIWKLIFSFQRTRFRW